MNLINAVGWITSPSILAAGIFEIPPKDMELIRKEYEFIRDGITVWLEQKFTGVLDFKADLMNGEFIEWFEPEFEEIFFDIVESQRSNHEFRGAKRK